MVGLGTDRSHWFRANDKGGPDTGTRRGVLRPVRGSRCVEM